MKNIYLILALLACPMAAIGQNAYDYYGDKVQLEAHYFQSKNFGKLQGDKKQAYQGMDIANGYMVSAQATGIVTVYKFGSELDKEKQVKLSTFSKTANAYNVSFSNTKMADDVLPLLYVSGNDGVASVERFDKKFKNATAVQTIRLSDVKASNVMWTIDKENNFLYALTSSKNGAHQVMRFAIPEVKGETAEEVKLSKADALDVHVIEDYFKSKTIASVNSVYALNGQLFITCGNGTPKDASKLLVWDAYGKMMRNVIDLSTATRGALKGCSVWNGAFYVQTEECLYQLIF